MTGLLLVNLGSPETPTTQGLRPYLKQFLMDPEVIDIPAIIRWPLVHWFIVPRRARESAALYRKIWTQNGSPLIYHSKCFAKALTTELSDLAGLRVELGMRYGQPSIRHALEQLHVDQLERLIVFPLYPQYAQSSTLTARTEVLKELRTLNLPNLEIDWIAPFYDDTGYLNAVRASAQPVLETFVPDFFLFSFHGLPERHMKRLHSVCLTREDCCAQVTEANRNCYRAQCYSTANALARALNLPAQQYSIAFQSRLGRTPWIKPYTDLVVETLPAQGIRRLAVFCPSFVADCLETLDEIENRERARFVSAGGEELRLVPSLNDSPVWVRAAADIVRKSFSKQKPAG
jgi:ferrochelatase